MDDVPHYHADGTLYTLEEEARWRAERMMATDTEITVSRATKVWTTPKDMTGTARVDFSGVHSILEAQLAASIKKSEARRLVKPTENGGWPSWLHAWVNSATMSAGPVVMHLP